MSCRSAYLCGWRGREEGKEEGEGKNLKGEEGQRGREGEGEGKRRREGREREKGEGEEGKREEGGRGKGRGTEK